MQKLEITFQNVDPNCLITSSQLGERSSSNVAAITFREDRKKFVSGRHLGGVRPANNNTKSTF